MPRSDWLRYPLSIDQLDYELAILSSRFCAGRVTNRGIFNLISIIFCQKRKSKGDFFFGSYVYGRYGKLEMFSNRVTTALIWHFINNNKNNNILQAVALTEIIMS